MAERVKTRHWVADELKSRNTLRALRAASAVIFLTLSVPFAAPHLAPPAFALTPSREHYCCQRSDIRAGECARFELTQDRCAEIRASFSQAAGRQMEIPMQRAIGERKASQMYDAIHKQDIAKVRQLLIARRSEPPNFARLTLFPMFLISAVQSGHAPIVAELIAEGVPINGGDADKKTALMHASEKGLSGIVAMLLHADADIRLKSMFGDTALSLAKEHGRNEIVALLVQQFALSRIDPIKVAEFIREGQTLQGRLYEIPLPTQEYNHWTERMIIYFKRHKGRAFVARLRDFSGMKFYGDGSEQSKLSIAIDTRLQRLHEFESEVQSELR